MNATLPAFESTVGIEVTFHGPTNHKGARLKAEFLSAGYKPLTIAWDYGMDTKENHAAAAMALAEREGMDLAEIAIVTARGYIFPVSMD